MNRGSRRQSRPVAVLGGGLQGCCIALALAEYGVGVHLYDRNSDLLTRTAVVNEGKLHLGYVYASDLTFRTARTLIRGALAFWPFMQRQLGLPLEHFEFSAPFTYLVHRDSQRSADDVAQYLESVHVLIGEASTSQRNQYFGLDLGAPLRRWKAGERNAMFDSSLIVDAFDTPEIAIEAVGLARAVRARISATPSIEVRLRRTVTSVDDKCDQMSVASNGSEGVARETYAHVVNALWDGRLAIDAGRKLHPSRPWLYRLKYGVRMRLSHAGNLPTITALLGPFGDLVVYRGGIVYISWYPVCMRGISDTLAPPNWPQDPSAEVGSLLKKESVRAMADLMLGLRSLDLENLPGASVKGGVIVAWGNTDIDDSQSELHQRHAIGVTSTGQYHSVDPGKMSMAPLFATIVADRIHSS